MNSHPHCVDPKGSRLCSDPLGQPKVKHVELPTSEVRVTAFPQMLSRYVITLIFLLSPQNEGRQSTLGANRASPHKASPPGPITVHQLLTQPQLAQDRDGMDNREDGSDFKALKRCPHHSHLSPSLRAHKL